MPLSSGCPNCQQQLKLRDELTGKSVRCPKCQHVFRVPAVGPAEQAMKQGPPAARSDVAAAPAVASPKRENVPDRPLRPRQGASPADSKPRREREPASLAREKPASRGKKNTLILWGVGLAAGLFVILACSGAAIWYYANSAVKSKGPATVAMQPLKDEVQKPEHVESVPKPPEVSKDTPPEVAKDPPKAKRTPDQSKGRISFPETGFSIVPPKGWVQFPSKSTAFLNMAAPKQFMAAKSYPADERQFSPNLNASWVPDDGAPHDLVRKQIKEQLPKQFKDWKLIDDEVMEIDGKYTYRIAFHCTIQSGATSLDLHLLQYSISSNNKIYIVGFGALPKSFGKLRDSFEQSARTIQVD